MNGIATAKGMTAALALPCPIHRADPWRYCIVTAVGGVCRPRYLLGVELAEVEPIQEEGN